MGNPRDFYSRQQFSRTKPNQQRNVESTQPVIETSNEEPDIIQNAQHEKKPNTQEACVNASEM